MMTGRDFYDDRSRFSGWLIETFMIRDRDFHDDRSIFSQWESRFSRQYVEILMISCQDFHDEWFRFLLAGQKFLDESKNFRVDWLTFSWWEVKIFMMAGGDYD